MTVASPRLGRDAVTWLVYLQIGIYGYVLYGIGPSIQLLRDETHVSKAVSGLHGTAMALGALVTGLAGAAVVERIGRGRALWGGVAVACTGVVVFTSATHVAVTLSGAFLATLGGSFVVNSTNTVMADYHGTLGSAAVSEAHAMAAGVGLLAPLVVGAAVAIGAGWRAGMLVCVAFALALAVRFRGTRVPDHRLSRDPEHDPGGALPARYWWAWSVLVMCVAVEFCMTIWTSDVLRDRAGLSDGAAAAGVTALVFGMAVGRFAAGRLAVSRSLDALLYGALVLAAAGFAIFWFSASPVPAFVGLIVCGLGIALHFPIGVIRAIKAGGVLADRAAARASVGIGIAVGLGPFALGALADRYSTRAAFLVVPVFLALAALAVWCSGDRPRGRRSATAPIAGDAGSRA